MYQVGHVLSLSYMEMLQYITCKVTAHEENVVESNGIKIVIHTFYRVLELDAQGSVPNQLQKGNLPCFSQLDI